MGRFRNIGDDYLEHGLEMDHVQLKMLYDSESRLFWVGPMGCSVLMTDEAIYGFDNVTRDGRVTIYESRERIPNGVYVAGAIAERLAEHEKRIIKRGGNLVDRILDLNEVLDKQGTRYQPGIAVRFVEDGIRARVAGTNGEVEIMFTRDMEPRYLKRAKKDRKIALQQGN